MTDFAQSADGRRIALKMSGDPSGYPVVMLHGTPGSKQDTGLPAKKLYHHGVRLITFDRPGYVESDRRVSRTVADVAWDVEAIANHLGLERFGVLGRSGGGPHALACAALLPERVTRAGILVSLAPWAAEGLDWFDGMADANVAAYKAAASDPEGLTAQLVQAITRIQEDPASHVAGLRPQMPAPDQKIVADVAIRAWLRKNFAELRGKPDGWIDDVLAFCSPWCFDLADIKIPVLLWHGEDDVFSPVAHARWLADQMPGAQVWIRPGTGHFGALEVIADVLPWLIGPG